MSLGGVGMHLILVPIGIASTMLECERPNDVATRMREHA